MKSTPAYGLASLGVINALGNNYDEVLSNLLTGKSPGVSLQSGWVPSKDVFVAAVESKLPTIDASLQQFSCRNNQLILAALAQIQDSVDELIERYGNDRIAVILGSSTSGILEGERALQRQAAAGAAGEDYHYRQQEIGSPAVFLARYLDLSGIAYTVSTACSSSAKAFAAARNLLNLDLCDAVIVGGSDSLCQLTLNGFSALESVSPELCNPFSANRAGITIGEGCALFTLSREPAAVNLLGVGESSDAHHISAPDPDGQGAEAAMRAAMHQAGVENHDINYLNLHGTATPKNDAMESLAVHRVLGNKTPCSSTKSLIGHTLGAAGASELALCWLLIQHGKQLPAQVWDGERDSSLADINILETSCELMADQPLRMMSNSFAFGGNNACVLIGNALATQR